MKILKSIRINVLIWSFLASLLVSFYGINKPPVPPPRGFALIELFTSEGCSSCPAADRLVTKLSKELVEKEVFILGFHIDYWNRLGWTDPYSNEEFTNRQKKYSRWLHQPSVYTPQIVVNGTTQFVGSDEVKLRNAVTIGLNTPAVSIDFKIVKWQDHKAVIEYSTGIQSNCMFYIACTQKNKVTQVKRGENGGRTLSHTNVVRNLQALPSGNKLSTTLFIPADFDFETWEMVGFLQNTTTGKILAASRPTK